VGCSDSAPKKSGEAIYFSCFREVPGLTREDIAAVEELIARRDSFVYGMMLSTEAFVGSNGSDGEIRGYSALVCEWLTELFGIPFVLEHFTWNEIFTGLQDGTVDFTGTMTPTAERSRTYFMTEPIAQRSIKYFRLVGSEALQEIKEERLPRYALLENAVSADNVIEYALYEFEPVFVPEYIQAHELLINGEVDALLAESTAEAIFDVFKNIVTSPFLPSIYSPVSLTAHNSDLEPIIKVVQQIFENGGKHYLDELYDMGHHEYLRHKMFLQLTEEEIDFIQNSPPIPFGAEYANYPICFYNNRYSEWQGIAFDVLAEISHLTGLEFEVANQPQVSFTELLEMLTDARVHMVSEVIRTPERAGLFIWPSNALMIDRSVLISRIDQPNITLNMVYSSTVGLSESSAHTEFFFTWFPNHHNYIIYESQQETFDALINREIDFVMNSYSTLLNLINYQELPDYKANILFDNNFMATFGINKDQVILCSIIDKSLELIDTEFISEHWRNRTYDYRLKLMQAQRPWIIGATGLLLCVLILVAVLWVRSRRASKNLEKLIWNRTKELAIQTATLTTLFDSIPDHIFSKDLNFRYVHCNKSLIEFFGLKKSNIVGKSDLDGLGVSAETAHEFIQADKKVINDGQTVISEQYIQHADGTNLLFEITKMPLTVDDNVIGVIGIAHNITERYEKEQQTAAVYEYSRKLNNALAKITQSPTISAGDLKEAALVIAKVGCEALNADNIGIWLMSESQTYLKSVCYYNNSDAGHIIQENFDLTCRQKYARLLNSERLVVMNNTVDCQMITAEDKNSYAACLCAGLDAPIRIDGKLVGVVCVEQYECDEYFDKREWIIEEQNFASSLADLMALAISGFERRKARDEAEIANNTKSTFLASMSHEIRTPMNAILGITEILIEDETLPEKIEEGLGKIYNSCGLLLGIINDILDFSKIEAGKLDITPRQYLVASMINDSVQLNSMRIESNPIEFEVQVDENIPAKLIGDELRIKQILNNLLSNAFKYTDSGKVTLSVSYDGSLILGVKDTGQGMSEEHLSRLFDEYARFNYETNAKIEGTGLGLNITQRLVGLMNGLIQVQSKQGVGSLFTVSLPQGIVDDEVLGKDIAENLRAFHANSFKTGKRSLVSREPMPYGNVLVVDDVETNLYVAIGLMKPYQLNIDTVSSGREAIEIIKSGKVYDVIFMDHMMPDIDGIETTKMIRELGYDRSIVALTANAVAGQADVFLNNGFDDFISKPVDVRQLNAILNKHIRDKNPDRVVASAALTTETAPKPSKLTGKSVDGINIAKGLKKFDDDEEIYLKILRSYVASAQEIVNSITTTQVNEQTLAEYRRNVHSLKGTGYDVFADEVADFAASLEKAAIAEDYDFISRRNREFVAMVQKLLSDLGDLLNSLDSQNPKPMKDKPDSQILSKIRAACELYDMDAVDEAMEELQRFTYTQDDGLADWLNERFNMMQFDKIVERLTDYIVGQF
jgi:PAS domain S-box-containing protein